MSFQLLVKMTLKKRFFQILQEAFEFPKYCRNYMNSNFNKYGTKERQSLQVKTEQTKHPHFFCNKQYLQNYHFALIVKESKTLLYNIA